MIILNRSLCLIAALLLWSGAAQALLIDDFSTAQTQIQNGASSQVSGTGIVGSQRSVTTTTGSRFTATTGYADVRFTSQPTTPGVVTLTYNGNSGANAPFPTLDLLADGSVRFQIDLDNPTTFNAGTAIFTVALTDSMNNSVNSTMSPVQTNGLGTQSLYVPYVNFTGSGSFDFTSVSSIQISITAPTNTFTFFSVNQIMTSIPEPSTLLLFGCGGLFWLYRRRQSATTQSLAA